MDTAVTHRRLALLPVDERPGRDRPVIRRYRLGRVLDDLGAALASPSPARVVVAQAPAQGVRAP